MPRRHKTASLTRYLFLSYNFSFLFKENWFSRGNSYIFIIRYMPVFSTHSLNHFPLKLIHDSFWRAHLTNSLLKLWTEWKGWKDAWKRTASWVGCTGAAFLPLILKGFIRKRSPQARKYGFFCWELNFS